MNRLQKLIYWIDQKTSLFERLEIRRADWFEDRFPLSAWFRDRSKILDLGSGVGDVTNKIAKHAGGVVVGVDYWDYRRKGNKVNSTHLYVRSDAHHLPFTDNSFDCVSTFWTLHHVQNPVKVFDEIARVLQPNGSFIILEDVIDSDSLFQSSITGIYDRIINLDYSTNTHHYYSLRGWRNLIEQNPSLTFNESIEYPWFNHRWSIKFALLRYEKKA